MAEQLTPEHFRPHLDKVFHVRGGEHALRLVEVQARQMPEWEAKAVPRQPFNLIFRGPPGHVLREGQYTFEIEHGPHFELYVMPIHTPTPDRQDYQAAFN
jgi:hypothetical protein